MTFFSSFKLCCLSVGMFLLVACSESSTSGAPGGIDRGGVTIGTVSGFGSVIVNGIRFNTDNANIFDGNVPADESRLDIGQVVMVTGDVDSVSATGIADAIVLTTELVGPVTSIDLGKQTLTILGHKVQLNDDTLFDQDNTSISTLQIGDYLRVYGLRASKDIVASRLEQETDTLNIDVSGRVQALDRNLQRFEINNQPIDYSMVYIGGDPETALQDGLFVRVKATTLLEGVVLAEVIINESARFKLAERTAVELEGVIDISHGSGAFTLSGYHVKFDAARTDIEGGSESDIVAGQRVEVEGTVNTEGAIFADEIKIKTASNAQIEGIVQSVDPVNNQLSMEGLTLNTTKTTQYLDKSEAKIRKFSLSDVAVGDKVEIRGYLLADRFIVTQLRREKPDNDIKIDGEVTALTREEIVVNGIVVRISEDTKTDKDFWQEVAVGNHIKVEAMRDVSGNIIASRLKI